MSSNRPSGQNTPGRPSRGGRPGSGFPNNRGGRPAGNPTTRTGGGPSTPRNPCRFFLQGNCREGTNCRFPHTTQQPNPQPQTQNAPPSNFPGLTNDQFSTRGTNDTPGKTHHLLKLYVADTFKFAIPDQVYKFVELLCNANSQNPNWTAVDGQTHLRDLVKGNGILRLADALRFPAETNRAWSFQRGYIPIFTYLSSEWVTKSTMNSDVNALYGLVHNELGVIRKTLETHMKRLMEARSFKEGDKALSGKQVFKVLFVTIFEYLTRYKQATTTNPEVCDLVEQIAQWFDDWVTGLQSNPPFDDECAKYETAQRDHIIRNLQHNRDQVLHVIRRTKVKVAQPEEGLARRGPIAEGLAARLQGNFKYDRPGENRESGPRHDNDHELIDKIRVAPTHAELLCEFEPFLPGNFLEAPHFYEAGSVERLLDIQFRLLREELTAPIRVAVQEVVSDLLEPRFATTALSRLINHGGGRYPNNSNAQDSVLFSVFTNVGFLPLSVNNRGTSVGVTFDAPPGARGRNRKDYWERVTKKHLMQDTLVALIWKDPTGHIDIYIGKVASTPQDLIDSAIAMSDDDRAALQVSFLDAAPELRIINIIQRRVTEYGTAVLIEAPVLYESIRPFLEALKRDPETLPFSQYLRLQPKEELSQVAIAPPLYSLTPGFSFQLKDLFDRSANVKSLSLTSHHPHSVENARTQLARASRLDPSQVNAVIGSLTREISLIQGPPGTGKSYTGLELIRVLLKNNVSPILLVAFTNHALDHMLNGVLKGNITEKIIRIGSRFRMDENLARFALEDLVKAQPKSQLDREVGTAFRAMKAAETQIVKLMNAIASRQIPPEHMSKYLLSTYPSHYNRLSNNVPAWILAVSRRYGVGTEDIRDADAGFTVVGKGKNYASIVEFWAAGEDLEYLNVKEEQQAVVKKGKKERIVSRNLFSLLGAEVVEDEDDSGRDFDFEPVFDPREELRQFLRQHGQEEIPLIPDSARPLEALQTDPKVWDMSLVERRTLYNIWITVAGESLRQGQVEEFEKLRQAHAQARMNFEERKAQARVNVLKRAHIIGCTTTGAAKVISLLSSVEPKVMIVEEAGQVLESHILASLVESVQQVVMIGDPLQLRPNVNSYKLSMDNPNTGKIYRFDQSLMERLSLSGFPMSQLAVQRRMRPEISSLIRNTLYPELEDNELVLKYPHVRGMSKDVYFISHTNKESGGGDESVSKYNQYEVDMIHDLVIHLLKQGCYNKERDIVILAAYLGQIPKIRQKLRGVVATLVDERDAELLEQRGIEYEESTVQKVDVSQQVIIRTLDNFQGEEGKIIILSLVRNSGTPFDGTVGSLQHGGRAPIGFLRVYKSYECWALPG